MQEHGSATARHAEYKRGTEKEKEETIKRKREVDRGREKKERSSKKIKNGKRKRTTSEFEGHTLKVLAP